jgi:hypothetical protein
MAAEPSLGIAAPESAPSPNEAHRNDCGFRVADLCRRWKVGADKIHGFLRRGELIGINLASNLSGRPLWRITRESVERFERRRSSAPPPKPPRRRRRLTVVDYYPD